MRYLLILPLLLCGCLGDAKRVEAKREKAAKFIPEITEIVRDSEYGRESALAYYWIFRVHSENVMARDDIDAFEAEKIGNQITENFGLKKGVVPGFAAAVKSELSEWEGDENPKGESLKQWKVGYCRKLLEIAESCRRAAK